MYQANVISGLFHRLSVSRRSCCSALHTMKETIADIDVEVSSYPTAAEVQQYLVSYANHFRLGHHLRLNTTVNRITFDNARHQWAVQIEGRDVQHFDKVVIAIGGLTSLPNVPIIEGLEKFKGTTLHSRAFKKPEDFAGKRVMVVGFGNTAADTATALANVAEKIYIAHRNGARIVSVSSLRSKHGAEVQRSYLVKSAADLSTTL